ncbi:unnamed protein product [Bursaphelenchus xylophilus]|uniref:(pine wood nematode) hypothetical protein n=1 Tax=Bursaphelenchus xylophilus TaxID=6326 RepID=A0A1I7SQU0_BURXY|nr:unnamed protein product [Bursaphelenchus xylophilus]CAG9110380.1 unnamed protein product [Bursaphelenchus xylophilus]
MDADGADINVVCRCLFGKMMDGGIIALLHLHLSRILVPMDSKYLIGKGGIQRIRPENTDYSAKIYIYYTLPVVKIEQSPDYDKKCLLFGQETNFMPRRQITMIVAAVPRTVSPSGPALSLPISRRIHEPRPDLLRARAFIPCRRRTEEMAPEKATGLGFAACR